MCFSELIFTLLTQLLVLRLYLSYLKWRLTTAYSAVGGFPISFTAGTKLILRLALQSYTNCNSEILINLMKSYKDVVMPCISL